MTLKDRSSKSPVTASGEFGSSGLSSGLTNSEYLFDKGLINILKSDRFQQNE